MATKPSQDDDQECIERTRAVLGATAALLANDELAVTAADDLAASDCALESARRALARCLEQSPGQLPGVRAAALMLDSFAVQASVKDALLQRRADVATGARPHDE